MNESFISSNIATLNTTERKRIIILHDINIITKSIIQKNCSYLHMLLIEISRQANAACASAELHKKR
jgi:hypothetical protein